MNSSPDFGRSFDARPFTFVHTRHPERNPLKSKRKWLEPKDFASRGKDEHCSWHYH